MPFWQGHGFRCTRTIQSCIGRGRGRLWRIRRLVHIGIIPVTRKLTIWRLTKGPLKSFATHSLYILGNDSFGPCAAWTTAVGCSESSFVMDRIGICAGSGRKMSVIRWGYASDAVLYMFQRQCPYYFCSLAWSVEGLGNADGALRETDVTLTATPPRRQKEIR